MLLGFGQQYGVPPDRSAMAVPLLAPPLAPQTTGKICPEALGRNNCRRNYLHPGKDCLFRQHPGHSRTSTCICWEDGIAFTIASLSWQHKDTKGSDYEMQGQVKQKH
eukprot:1816846-Rhodomonas_salina.1